MQGFLNFNDLEEQNAYIPFNSSKMEAAILADKYAYYEIHSENIFYDRPSESTFYDQLIGPKEIEYLSEIKKILQINKIEYKIIISPLYDQKKLNIKDVKLIEKYFGKDNIYDFSGKNSITKNKYNYYEQSHFRKKVGKKILNIIYPNMK